MPPRPEVLDCLDEAVEVMDAATDPDAKELPEKLTRDVDDKEPVIVSELVTVMVSVALLHIDALSEAGALGDDNSESDA